MSTLLQIAINFDVPLWGVITYFLAFLGAMANMWKEQGIMNQRIKSLEELIHQLIDKKKND